MIHKPQGGNPVPIEGIGPKARIQFTSRGHIRTGATHATMQRFDSAASIKGMVPVKTLCGRDVVPMSVYGPESWPSMAEFHEKFGRTHVTGTCGRCVAKAPSGVKA